MPNTTKILEIPTSLKEFSELINQCEPSEAPTLSDIETRVAPRPSQVDRQRLIESQREDYWSMSTL